MRSLFILILLICLQQELKSQNYILERDESAPVLSYSYTKRLNSQRTINNKGLSNFAFGYTYKGVFDGFVSYTTGTNNSTGIGISAMLYKPQAGNKGIGVSLELGYAQNLVVGTSISYQRPKNARGSKFVPLIAISRSIDSNNSFNTLLFGANFNFSSFTFSANYGRARKSGLMNLGLIYSITKGANF